MQLAKQVEVRGQIDWVAISAETRQLLRDKNTTVEPIGPYGLVCYGNQDDTLGNFDISLNRRSLCVPILRDASPTGVCEAIQCALPTIKRLASYLPRSVLRMLVDNAGRRKIMPSFPTIAVAFVNLMGLHEVVDEVEPDELEALIVCFSQTFAVINGIVESYGGILQKSSYHAVGSEMLIHFGALTPHPSNAQRAAKAVLAIRDRISAVEPPVVKGRQLALSCRIGLTYGPVFSAEIGGPKGRRELNVLGNTVNTAVQLMGGR